MAKIPRGLTVGKFYRVLFDLPIFKQADCREFLDLILETDDLVLVTDVKLFSETDKRKFWSIQAIFGETVFYILANGDKWKAQIERVYEPRAT